MRRALDGIKVVELGHVMAGPVCGRMLADLGADVVKIEPPRGDPTRTFAPGGGNEEGISKPYAMLNRGKRGMVVNLKSPAGVEAVRRILTEVDVVVENFRPGVMDGLGLGYDALSEANPGLIYCQITGFGRVGPLATLGGFDLVAQGITGLLSVTGEGPGRPPTKCGPPLTDITAGLLGALGVLAALHARQRTGRGQRVDTSLYQAGVFQTLWHSAVAMATGKAPEPLGSAHPLAAPYQAFETADGWITVGGSNQASWLRLLDVLGEPELAEDPRFADNRGRMTHRTALEEVLSRRFATDTTDAWLERLAAAGVPAGPVLNVPEMLDHPQTASLDMILSVEGASDGLTLGLPLALSEAPGPAPGPAPPLGRDTDLVLEEHGFTAEEVAKLRDVGAVL